MPSLRRALSSKEEKGRREEKRGEEGEEKNRRKRGRKDGWIKVLQKITFLTFKCL